ncbi:hypothetical protein [Dactylosporangium sp. CA-092794]|uniref:hypothetical protein n=1 Tax=Dactylosporangium sp. CA-092794 TaxID=3239929 RepID=UPI003D8D4E96
MPRKPASRADEQLLDAARLRNAPTTITKLERWRAAGLVPPNLIRSLGRGRGTTSTAHRDALDLVVWLVQHARPGRRPHDLALKAFGDGLPVPLTTVRAAWRAAVHRLVVPGEQSAPVPAGAEERAERAWDLAERAAAGRRTGIVVIPRRMRRIDARITGYGMPWNVPDLAQYDRGLAGSEPVMAKELTTFAVAGVLAGAAELTGPAMAPYVRAVLPPGAASPIASWMEYPEGDIRDAADVADDTGLRLLPAGDVRQHLLRVIDGAPPEQLRAAWRAAADMRAWALGECAAVEAELDSGALGDATVRWMLAAAIGLPRFFVRDVLTDRRWSTATRVATAITLLDFGAGMQRLRQLVPDAQFDLLPQILPLFLHELAGAAAPAAQCEADVPGRRTES